MYRRASEPGSAYCASGNAAGNDLSGAARWVAMCLLRVSRPSVDDRRIAWVVLNATRPEGVVMTEPDDPSDLALQSRVLGGLPIINAVTDRLGLPALLAAALPDGDPRVSTVT